MSRPKFAAGGRAPQYSFITSGPNVGGDPYTMARNAAVQADMRAQGQIRGLGCVSCGTFGGLGETSPEARARGEAAIAAVLKAARGGGLGAYMVNGPSGLAQVFSHQSLAGLGASAKASGAAQGASTGASVGSVIPGVGTAIGAVIGAVAGALFSKKKDPNAAEKEALKGNLDKYMQVQGTIPGRAMDLLGIKQLIDGAGYRGMWPNVKKWSGDAITGAIDGCKGCTPPTIRQFVADQVKAGDIDPFSLANKFTDIVNKTWGSKWFVASAGATQRQLMVDLMDFFIAQNKPDAPLFYAPDWTTAANTPPATATPSNPAGTVVPITPTPAPTPAPGLQLPSVPTIPGNIDMNALNALMDSLKAQGASAQQAYLAALQQLQSQGVAVTPQVQQAVASQAATAGVAGGLPDWAKTGGIVAGVALLAFALARPASRRKG